MTSAWSTETHNDPNTDPFKILHFSSLKGRAHRGKMSKSRGRRIAEMAREMKEAEQNTCTSGKNENVQEKENIEKELLPFAEISQASRTFEMTCLEDDEELFPGTSSGSIYHQESNYSGAEKEHSQYEEENLREFNEPKPRINFKLFMCTA
ncbi:hypothetical protein JTB14_009304 [Gonioctena quinquepunctata]|nr:hypothetical protein JTB14_009304 [Gonioctena quinquepunctata]